MSGEKDSGQNPFLYNACIRQLTPRRVIVQTDVAQRLIVQTQNILVSSVTLMWEAGNKDPIYIGDKDVTSATGIFIDRDFPRYEISPRMFNRMSLGWLNLSEIYILGTVDDECRISYIEARL